MSDRFRISITKVATCASAKAEWTVSNRSRPFRVVRSAATRVPTEWRKLFTSRDRQDAMRIVVCQGESRRLDQDVVIGDLVLQNLPPRLRGETSLEVAASCRSARAPLALVGEVAASRERLQQLKR
jgi:molecular chaperone DnaK (HSP70)